MSELNCDQWAEVDFGNGPVDVRCTEEGDHDVHKCNVIFVIINVPNPDHDEEAAEKEHDEIMRGEDDGIPSNIFDQDRTQE